MFDQLVESGSHSADLKRKGGFLIGFTIAYLVLIVVGAVAGIMLATANIDQQTLELTALIAPVPVPQQQQKQEAKPEKQEVAKNVDVRKEAISDVTDTRTVPKEVSAKASDIPPIRKNTQTIICPTCGNSNAINPVAPGSGGGNIISAPTRVEIKDEPP